VNTKMTIKLPISSVICDSRGISHSWSWPRPCRFSQSLVHERVFARSL